MLRILLLLGFAGPVLSACFLPDCETQYFVDRDGDGFGEGPGTPKCPANVRSDDVEIGGDCDDDDPMTFPGAPESCEPVDRDCDGQIAADTMDGDGDGWSTCDGDCDDTDADVFPGAMERCNGLDDDCDGFPESDDLELDRDDDGFTGCDGDCDDADPLVNPDALDVCNGIDDDCVGGADSMLDAFEPNDDPRQAFDLGADGGILGRADAAFSSPADPADWFSFFATDEENTLVQAFTIFVEVRLGDSPLGVRVALQTESGTELDAIEVRGPLEIGLLIFAAPIGSDQQATGTYRVEVVPLEGAEDCDATYTLFVDVRN
ncbi:MAG: putative metal-binding motif-containing protein [Myxococcota bacterium]